MSYYDFDNHFWSPQTVCSQSTQPKSNKKIARQSIQIGILTLACVAVWTPLLLQSLLTATKENQEKISLDTKNPSGDRLLIERERFQSYISHYQR